MFMHTYISIHEHKEQLERAAIKMNIKANQRQIPVCQSLLAKLELEPFNEGRQERCRSDRVYF